MVQFYIKSKHDLLCWVLVMCSIVLPPTSKGRPTVIPWWSWGQHDYSCRRVQLLVHGLCPVKRGLDQVLFSKGYELHFKERSGDRAQDPKMKLVR